MNMHAVDVVAVFFSVAASLLWQASATVTDARIIINEATAVPMGHSTNFTCVASKQPYWNVRNHNGLNFWTAATAVDIINEKYGINVSAVQHMGVLSYSNLVIEGRFCNNGSIIHCGTQESSGIDMTEENVTFSVFDLPTGLVSRPVGVTNVLLLWSPSLIHPTISYIVEVTSESHYASFFTNSTSLLLNPSMLSRLPRLPYHVRVKATNEVGQETDFGDGVNACTRIDVSNSINCEVEITPSSMLVTVSFTSPSCSFYEDSTLIWSEAEVSTVGSGATGLEYNTASLVNFTSNGTRVSLLFNSTHIRENAVINYVVQVFDNISISRERTFYTTDVQEATFLLDLDAGFFEVTCRFATGSRAKGCVLVLSGSQYNISRYNNSASYSQNFTQPSGELNYSVYDWEEDGSMGVVAVKIQSITRTTTTISPVPSPAPPPTSPPHQPSQVLPPFVIPLVVVLALLFMFCVILLCCVYYKRPCCPGSSKTYAIRKSRRKESNCYTSTEVKKDGELWHGGEDTYSTVYDSLQHHTSKHGVSSLPGPPPVPSSRLPSSLSSPPSSPLGPQPLGLDTENYATLEETTYSTIAKIPLYQVLEKPPPTVSEEKQPCPAIDSPQESIPNGRVPPGASFALYSEVNDGPPPFSSPMYTEVGTSMEESRPPIVPVPSHMHSGMHKQTDSSSSLQMYSEVHKGKSREKSPPPIIPMVVLNESHEQQANSEVHKEEEGGVPLTPPPVYTEVHEGQVPPKTPPPMYSE